MNQQTQKTENRTLDRVFYLAQDSGMAEIVESTHEKNEMLIWVSFHDETEIERITSFFEYVRSTIEEDNRWYKTNVEVERIIKRATAFLIVINLGGN